MRWTATYRKPDGTRGTEDLEAESRKEALGILKERGISVIRLDVAQQKRKVIDFGLSIKIAGGLATIAVVAVIISTLWDSPADKPSTEPTAGKRLIVPHEPAHVSKSETIPSPENKLLPTPAAAPIDHRAEFMDKQRAAMAKKLGRRKEHAIVTNHLNGAEAPTHKNATEQIMLMVFGTEVGDMPLPLPAIPERDKKRLTEILMDKHTVSDEDSEAVKIDKEILTAAKEEFRNYLKDGGDPDEFFPYYHKQLESAYQERRVSQKYILETARNGDVELAERLLEEVNKKLESRGIKPVRLPAKALKPR